MLVRRLFLLRVEWHCRVDLWLYVMRWYWLRICVSRECVWLLFLVCRLIVLVSGVVFHLFRRRRQAWPYRPHVVVDWSPLLLICLLLSSALAS